jgi:hypothetical protein
MNSLIYDNDMIDRLTTQHYEEVIAWLNTYKHKYHACFPFGRQRSFLWLKPFYDSPHVVLNSRQYFPYLSNTPLTFFNSMVVRTFLMVTTGGIGAINITYNCHLSLTIHTSLVARYFIGLLQFNIHTPLTLYSWRGSRGISGTLPRCPRFTKMS